MDKPDVEEHRSVDKVRCKRLWPRRRLPTGDTADYQSALRAYRGLVVRLCHDLIKRLAEKDRRT
jgi:hypothetical protein